MVLAPEPVFGAVEAVEATPDGLPRPLFLLSASGRPFDQAVAQEWPALPGGFSLLCGRYEGVDQRVADHLCDGELSIGDFVLAGGELAALVVVEAVARLLPGVLGQRASRPMRRASPTDCSSTRSTPARPTSGARAVPEVLRSGDHGRVDGWRRAQSLARTLRRRPDLMAARGGLTDEEVALLGRHGEVRLLHEHGYD